MNEGVDHKYLGKKITKDHNTEIIFSKTIKPDRLKEDFIFGKANLMKV